MMMMMMMMMDDDRQYTVPLCLGVRDPGVAELRSIVSCVKPSNQSISIYRA